MGAEQLQNIEQLQIFDYIEEPEGMTPQPAPQIVGEGDLWQLGRHRLICGDSTDPATISRLLPSWCDVIIKRWETITGGKAVKIS